MSSTAIAAPAWLSDLTFIAAVALPEEWADEFGTTVNGMWADPEDWTPETVAAAHAKGRRILVSVPLIALTHQVYEREAFGYLMDEVCRDIDGGLAEVEWYYWDAKPVYALCIHSPVVRTYLVDRLRGAMESGADLVNADEIQTNIGLLTRKPKGSGFCDRCLTTSEAIRVAAGSRGVNEPPAADVRAWLRDDLELFEAFMVEQQAKAFKETKDLLEELRTIARSDGQPVAITANVTALGGFIGSMGRLWSAAWGELVDVIMLEAMYLVSRSQFDDADAHKLLPRGTFAPLYRLGMALGPRVPIWITPQINVPRQLAGQRRQRYYELMFLEAYANRGRWGYNWWPGVDAAARREATAPDAIKTWTAFMRAHRDLYVGLGTANDVAVVYSNAAVLAEPAAHNRYLALAQALYEAGVQFDVIFTGDDQFAAADLEAAELEPYRLLLLPAVDGFTPSQERSLDAFRARGGHVTGASATSPLGERLDRFWAAYDDLDRAAIVAACDVGETPRIHASASRVVATRYVSGPRTLLHLLNYDYRAERDEVVPATDLVLTLSWAGKLPSVRLLSPTEDVAIEARLEGARLRIRVPVLRDHAVVEILG